ncbi:MAG TPA: glycosyltransferase family 4 protein [Limnochordia bacterium]|nr:glycosyltransferase family 4 protein [Limnochordia bacterium]
MDYVGARRDSASRPLNVLITAEMLSLGGVATHVATLAAALQREGLGVAVRARRYSELMRSVLVGSGIDHDTYATPAELRQLIASHAIDLVHAHPFDNLIASAAAARLAGVPLVTTAHSTPYALWPVRRLRPLPDHIVCVSADVKRVLDRAGIRSDRASVIENGVEIPTAPPPLDWRAPRAAYIGRLDVEKRQAVAAVREACRRLGWGLDIAGGRPREFPPAPTQPLRPLRQTGDEVVWPPAADLAPIYQRVQVVCAAGRSAMEALAWGRVVLVVNETGYDGIVTPESAGRLLVGNFSARGPSRAPLDADRLAADLEQAAASGDALADFGRAFAIRHLDVVTAVRRHLAVYEQVTARRREGRRLWSS